MKGLLGFYAGFFVVATAACFITFGLSLIDYNIPRFIVGWSFAGTIFFGLGFWAIGDAWENHD